MPRLCLAYVSSFHISLIPPELVDVLGAKGSRKTLCPCSSICGPRRVPPEGEGPCVRSMHTQKSATCQLPHKNKFKWRSLPKTQPKSWPPGLAPPMRYKRLITSQYESKPYISNPMSLAQQEAHVLFTGMSHVCRKGQTLTPARQL